ncbi:MAG: internal scaffolding protein [Microviridae sp.]|nr:MAG: internal scaffolding protein [Microviridae sp.]
MAKSNVERTAAQGAAPVLLTGTSAEKGYRSYATERFGRRDRFITPVVGESMTKQSFKDECDINVIMRRYEATGILPGMERAVGARYIDCRDIDYQEAMILVASAKSAFADLPARLRDRFGNDPAKLMSFLQDERNLEEARELGLVNAEQKVAAPLAVRVVESPVGDSGKTSGVSEGGSPSVEAAAAKAGRKA